MENDVNIFQNSFKWNIEHIAELKPVDIDEMPRQQDPHHKPGSEAEARAQSAIDSFFKNNLIAPSPWTGSTKKKTKCLTITPDSGIIQYSIALLISTLPVECVCLALEQKCLDMCGSILPTNSI